MTDTAQQRIEQFGDGPTRPVLLSEARVGPINVGEREDYYPGYRGAIPARGAYGFVDFCSVADRNPTEPETYRMPVKVLNHLRSRDVTIILVADIETNIVWEFHESQLDESVPKSDLPPGQREEAQNRVLLAHHRGRYPEHRGSVMVDMDR